MDAEPEFEPDIYSDPRQIAGAWANWFLAPGRGSDAVVLSEEHQRILDAIRQHEIEEWQKARVRRQADRPPEPETS